MKKRKDIKQGSKLKSVKTYIKTSDYLEQVPNIWQILNKCLITVRTATIRTTNNNNSNNQPLTDSCTLKLKLMGAQEEKELCKGVAIL